MIVFDNLEELITQGYRCLIRMAYRSKSVTRPRLIDQSTGKEKRKKSFQTRSQIFSWILKYDEIVYDTETCCMHRFTLRNRDKATPIVKYFGIIMPESMCTYRLIYSVEPRDRIYVKGYGFNP